MQQNKSTRKWYANLGNIEEEEEEEVNNFSF
jgi:hypothetical protein